MGIPWLHGEASVDASKGEPFRPLLQDEAPRPSSGGLSNGHYPALVQGPLQEITCSPVGGSLCQGVGVLPCQLVGMFSPLVGIFRHLCRWCPRSHFWPGRSPQMVNGSFTHPPGRAGKFPYPCRIIGSTPDNLPSGSWPVGSYT